MGIFGWSYPPGCSGPPDEDFDDTICAECGAKLPDEILEGTPQFDGFCDIICKAKYYGGIGLYQDPQNKKEQK